MTRVVTAMTGDLDGLAQLAFRPSPVALLETPDDTVPACGCGVLAHPAVGRRIAVAVSTGPSVYAALLTPAEAETFAARLLRAAAEAQAEGRA